jgi:hypothetical protein
MGETKNAFKTSVEKLAVTRPLGMLRRTWENNIKMDVRVSGVWTGFSESG